MNQLFSCLYIIIIFYVLNIPFVSAQEPDKVVVSGKTYYLHEVQQGEGFYRIAKKYGVTQKEIHDANPNSLFGLKAGDLLYIPVIEGRKESGVQQDSDKEFIYHTIDQGQTLYYLSRKYNVSIEDIKKYNVGADQKLLIGSIFKIPVYQRKDGGATVNYIYHQVEPKETLYGISKKYNVSISEIIKSNPALQSGIIEIGTKIRIPKQAIQDKIINTPKVVKEKMEDENFIYHRIVTGDTFYSLSKKYNVAKNAIYVANPDLNPDDLSVGYVVRVPKAEIEIEQSKEDPQQDFITHVVKRKETVYSIARKYSVKVEDLEEANPTLVLSNIKKGSRLKIPGIEYLKRKKEQELVEDDVVREKMVTHMGDSVFVDCGLYDYTLSKENISVALLLPFDVAATKEANVITKIVDDEEVEMAREEPVLSNRSRSFVEFYEGVLMALDSVKKQGVNIELYTYDTAPDTNKVKAILERPELKNVDFIIGPAFTSNLSLVSEFSYQNGIKMIYPLSNKDPEINRNPYLIQVNTPDSLVYDKYVSYISSQSEGSRVLVLKSKEPGSLENQFCNKLKDQIYLKYIPLGQKPNYLEVSFSEQDVQAIDALLDDSHPNIVVIPSPEEADISKIITTLHGVVDGSDKNVKLIGFGDWLKYQTINAEEVHNLNTEIISSYALDYNSELTKNFVMKYRKWYHTEPFAVSPFFIRPGRNAKYSKYGIWGYDVAYYFLNARIKYGKQFEYCLPHYKANQVQFNFDFERYGNWGGLYNRGLYVIRFGKELEVERTEL
ncbi:LysM peptidoglycan-binding domain-containing protein [Plebeiibacterium marinum]|uniref:LysM peptidoglycan-binding domain-containing protein n=1 Tax=Plebeiibacterium marinum TaxID=2992111 RepID=A0AAE3MHI1_9BACT|nr:LysM peptidoglycan-binding domain-containing protein [Plebeiobacterium marinum]MCW3807689.1 LysM peptidoglycan-binding domain-containing protein [Plebeiobacterium marinum]